MVGLAAAADTLATGGKVQILVPSIELQSQWAASARKHLPGRLVETLGGGSRPRSASSDVLISVVNSARRHEHHFTPRNSLLVGDECHRYGSTSNALALSHRFDRRLGISATYARSDDGNARYLDPYFGKTCFRMGYKRAIADGVTARFKVALIPVRFPGADERAYDECTRRAADARRWLVTNGYAPEHPFGEFMKRVTFLADAEYGSATWKARAFLKNFADKRKILAETPTKIVRLRDLVHAVHGCDRAILFTQTIEAAEASARTLCAHGITSEAIHSHLDFERRRAALMRFGRGELKAVSAPQVLDEGIDVPGADLAIILAASHSRRQMIQRMGRVLRKKPDQRLARFAVLYVVGTSEDPRLGAHETFLEEITSVADAVRMFNLNDRAEEICGYLNDHGGRKVSAPPQPSHSGATSHVRVASGAQVHLRGDARTALDRAAFWRDRPFRPSATLVRRRLGADAPTGLSDPASRLPPVPCAPVGDGGTPAAALTPPSFDTSASREHMHHSHGGRSARDRKLLRAQAEAQRRGLTLEQLLAERRAQAERNLELHRIATSRGMSVRQLRRSISLEDPQLGKNMKRRPSRSQAHVE
jgi:superfamily II DNA or RNA helicase